LKWRGKIRCSFFLGKALLWLCYEQRSFCRKKERKLGNDTNYKKSFDVVTFEQNPACEV
jgi:hypothetical protein